MFDPEWNKICAPLPLLFAVLPESRELLMCKLAVPSTVSPPPLMRAWFSVIIERSNLMSADEVMKAAAPF